MINGKTLLDWGLPAGKHMKPALAAAHAAFASGGEDAARAAALTFMPTPRIKLRKADPAPLKMLLTPDGEAEWKNLASVERDMRLLMQVPTVRAGAIMPDACPAGIISVGGVVEAENAIHPGFHSADICCSVMATIFDAGTDPKALLDAGHSVTHFGGGGRRDRVEVPPALAREVLGNPMLRPLADDAAAHFATQGDGNHFMFVGRLRSNGMVALVTHHGSRRPGAQLYKTGMKIAKAMTAERAEGIQDQAAWIPADTDEGRTYWAALQTIREWTKQSHLAIHRMTARASGAREIDWFWNEHNFVFERKPGRFLHGKGATPAWGSHHADADSAGRVLIPLNMAEPVLIARGLDNDEALGFAPHGAGRNFSRSQFMRDYGAENGAAELQLLREGGLDARFWFDAPDASELPSAYKNADAIQMQTEGFGLAAIEDYIDPYGCIMAGNWVPRETGTPDGRSG